MSYYAKSQFYLTIHAAERIKQRLKLDGEIADIYKKIHALFDNSILDFRDKNNFYYLKILTKGFNHLYFVVSPENIIVTVTPISVSKKMQLF